MKQHVQKARQVPVGGRGAYWWLAEEGHAQGCVAAKLIPLCHGEIDSLAEVDAVREAGMVAAGEGDDELSGCLLDTGDRDATGSQQAGGEYRVLQEESLEDLLLDLCLRGPAVPHLSTHFVVHLHQRLACSGKLGWTLALPCTAVQ